MTTFEGHDLASYYNCRVLDAYETSILYIVFWRFDSITLSRQRLANLTKLNEIRVFNNQNDKQKMYRIHLNRKLPTRNETTVIWSWYL